MDTADSHQRVNGLLGVIVAEVGELPWRWREGGVPACARGCRVIESDNEVPMLLTICGVGMQRAAVATAHAVEVHGVHAVLIVGFCGVLDGSELGRIRAVSEVTWRDDPRNAVPEFPGEFLRPSRSLVESLRSVAERLSVSLESAHAASGEVPVRGADDARIARARGADIVDMETWAVARECQTHGTHWAALRVGCDRADADAAYSHTIARDAGPPTPLTSLIEGLALSLASPHRPMGREQQPRNEPPVADTRWPGTLHPWTARGQRPGPTEIARAWGPYIESPNGAVYLDGNAGTRNVVLGHGYPSVMPRVLDQAKHVAHFPSDGGITRALGDFSAALLDVLPGCYGGVLTNSGGSEAIEAALRYAGECHRRRGEPHRVRILSLFNGYHGVTRGAGAVSALACARQGAPPDSLGGAFIPTPASDNPGDIEVALAAAETLVSALDASTISAIIFEPTLGLGGVRRLPAEFLSGLMDLCEEIGALSIADEVGCGLGRTGHWLDASRAARLPDIVVLGKALSNGTVPLSATVLQRSLSEMFGSNAISYGHTYTGHPLAAAAGSAVLDALKRLDCPQRARQREREFLDGFASEIASLSHVRSVRTAGLWVGVEVVSPETGQSYNPAAISDRLMDRGVLHEVLGPVISVAPPLNIPRSAWQTIGAALSMAFREGP